MSKQPIFFESPKEFRAWLRRNHRRETELFVGYHKKHTGAPSMTWPESVEEALCYGWIDGVRKTIDGDRYMIRFTPRRPDSVWSATNIRLMEKLEDAGRMTAAGRRIFEARREERSAIYSFEQEKVRFDESQEKRFRRNRKAWRFFEEQPPGYRRKATWWVVSAKRQDTRDRRLAALIECSAAGERIPQLQS
ncbi:MAG: YdeI/OmpD-associated family protein [Planctomycetota bacterium]|nr:YdeI/OmpD-associated family protein [Planctomycetota bacterium]